MNRIFERRSAFSSENSELIAAVGKAMVVFAGIEGAVNFALEFLVNNHIIWRRIARTAISNRLELFGELLVAKGLPETDVRAVVSKAMTLFTKRNIIAHNPIAFHSASPLPIIVRIDGKKLEELSAPEIVRIAEEADDVYDLVWQLFSTYQFQQFNDTNATT